jgi:hypothetical protein
VRRTTRVMVALAAAIALVACAGGNGAEDVSPSPALEAIERPSSTAELTIRSPRVGQVVGGGAVDLRVRLSGATIVPQTTTTLSPDEGHLHVLLDDTLISMTEGLEQTIPDVEAGPHRLTVEFVAADHAPFDPRVVAVVQFEVAT